MTAMAPIYSVQKCLLRCAKIVTMAFIVNSACNVFLKIFSLNILYLNKPLFAVFAIDGSFTILLSIPVELFVSMFIANNIAQLMKP